ncbi:hypothetical protein SAMN06272721_11629 [Arthrobacter sp. P2b]|nr:hypothetical protein SAMN06272721_11629 [Arthrobacter sp. P2b]
MTTTSEFKYLDPDIYEPADYGSAEDFTVDEAMGLWEEAAEASFHELPEPGTTCQKCSTHWNACTCPDGATYDSDVFFIHDDAEEIASYFLAAWEYSLLLHSSHVLPHYPAQGREKSARLGVGVFPGRGCCLAVGRSSLTLLVPTLLGTLIVGRVVRVTRWNVDPLGTLNHCS